MAKIAVNLDGGVAADIWRQIPRKIARRLVRKGQTKFVEYTGPQGFAALSLTPARFTLPGCISQLPGHLTLWDRLERFLRKLGIYLFWGGEYYQHSRSVALAVHNDTKQALIGRYVYWLCTSVNSEPVHHVRFECTTYNGTETTAVSSEGDDGAEKYWSIFTAVHTFTADDTVNRIHLENVGDVEYAEYPNDGDPDLAQAVSNTDVLTINWKREVNGTPNLNTKAGQALPHGLNQTLQGAYNLSQLIKSIYVSYDAGVTWHEGAANKIAGGALTDNYVQFEAEIAVHGEPLEQTIDHSTLHYSTLTPALATAYCWNGAASEPWPPGQSKKVQWKITITDYVAGETV